MQHKSFILDKSNAKPLFIPNIWHWLIPWTKSKRQQFSHQLLSFNFATFFVQFLCILVGVLSLLVNRSQAYAVLLDVKIKGCGFVVLISKGETFISKSAAVSFVLKQVYKLVTNLNYFHRSVPYLIEMLLPKCLLHVKC